MSWTYRKTLLKIEKKRGRAYLDAPFYIRDRFTNNVLDLNIATLAEAKERLAELKDDPKFAGTLRTS